MNDELWTLWPWLRRGFSVSQARQMQAYLSALRRRLAAEARGAGDKTTATKLNRLRYARRKAQSRRKQFLKGRSVVWKREILSHTSCIPELILDSLCDNRFDKWVSPFDRQINHAEIDLASFSFIDDPKQAMASLEKIAALECYITHGRLNFIDQNCLDVGPFLVLQEMQKGMLPVYSGGRITKSVQHVLGFVNLQKPLQMNFKKPTDTPEVWPLPFRSRSDQDRTEVRLLLQQTSEIVAGEVTRTINQWLSTLTEMELAPQGESLLLKFIGETLNNAERHSIAGSDEGSWCVAGFLKEHSGASGKAFRCHLALLNKGRTIAESINTANSKTLTEMGYYVNRHKSKTFRSGFTEENLATVYALQDGVSRVFEALERGRGGTGFMDMLEFFAHIGATSNPEWLPKFSIVSGKTCVRIKQPYIVGKRRSEAPGADGLLPPRELWFNHANSPSAAPDPNFVFELPAKLQGTLVTVAWTLDRDYLESTSSDAD